jgi:o-succinylbenzoate synthase
MRVRRVDVVTHAGAVSGSRIASARITERRGLLLRVEDRDGRVAQGEASPLPGYSTDSFETAKDALERVDWTALPEPDPAGDASAMLAALPVDLAATSNAARFAVETVLLDVLGQRAAAPLWALLGSSKTVPVVPLSSFAGGVDDTDVIARARDAAARGVRTIKVKILGPSLGAQCDVLGAVRAAIAGAALRLDANGSLDPRSAHEELERLVALRPELVEEPVPAAALGTAFVDPPLSMALDESLQDPAHWKRLAEELERIRCVAVVLKLTALGGFSRCLKLAREASKRGLDVTVSHTFDGPIALAASAHFALAVASRTRASGLDKHGGLAVWPPTSVALLGETELTADDRPGLGLAPLTRPR